MRRIAIVSGWLLLLLLGAAAYASEDGEDACSVQAVSVEGQSGFVYFPFADRDEVRELRLAIDSRGQCRLGLALLPTSGAELRGPGQPLNVTFRDRRDQVIPLNGNEQQWVPFEQTARGTIASLAVGLPRGQARRAGDYVNTFVARIFANGRPVREIDFQLSVRVAPQADLQVAGNAEGRLGRSAGMNFGELETGETLSALLAVRANGAYNLSVASDNKGVLRHTSLNGDMAAVPYTAWIDGRRLSLQGGADMQNYAAPQDGRRLRNISVQIGETRGRMAGQYRDTLRVTVTLLE
ncbi:hypothetical protein [Microbulbifer hainanensis]|uniref:hypothetical protein n=1 Tax=Microbulbifer hainanensis TaxID=2735675 RepID=UPI0018684AD8|nr:hypothetical protein [Microbulbifer hainanensis]